MKRFLGFVVVVAIIAAIFGLAHYRYHKRIVSNGTGHAQPKLVLEGDAVVTRVPADVDQPKAAKYPTDPSFVLTMYDPCLGKKPGEVLPANGCLAGDKFGYYTCEPDSSGKLTVTCTADDARSAETVTNIDRVRACERAGGYWANSRCIDRRRYVK